MFGGSPRPLGGTSRARPGPSPPATIRRVAKTFRGGGIMGIRIPTVFSDTDAIRCAGCGESIAVTPFRVSIMDAFSVETPPSWASSAPLNPGPHQFHADPACFRAWARARGHYLCRLSAVRELMRPVALPGEAVRWGLCDGEHRAAHEFVPA